jgi:hypothetical protein
VNFPSNPAKIVVDWAGPVAAQIDFFQDGLEGIYFWSSQNSATCDWFDIFRKDTTVVDYSLFPQDVDLSGTHDIFMAFSCAGSGCGNYRSFTFFFDDAKAQDRIASQGNPAAPVGRTGLVTVAAGSLGACRTYAFAFEPAVGGDNA